VEPKAAVVEEGGEAAANQPEPQPAAAKKQAEPDEDLEPVYDFAENVAQAHVRSGGMLVDFGTPSRHKHTIGDWKTGWRGDFSAEEVTFSYVAASPARVYFNAHPDEADAAGGRVTIRARAIGSTKGRIFLNGKLIGSAEFPKDEFAHATIDFDRPLRKGRNELLLRFDRRRPGHDGRGAAIAVDYIRVVPTDSDSGPAASAFDAVSFPDAAGGVPGLVLAAGESLTYYVPIPPGAAIRGRARARGQVGGGKLEVRVATDDGQEPLVAHVDVGDESGLVRLGLAELAGRTAAITLAAVGGEIVLVGCAVMAEKVGAAPAPGAVKAKNFVLVLIDTLRADHLKLYASGTRVQTDYMDRLGQESMVFDRAWVQENWTKPSVATMLTGLYPETHRTKNEKHKLPRSVVLASEHFRALGFATAGFVANGYVSHKFGFREGWDIWRNYVREGKANRAKFVADDAIAWLGRRPKDKPFFLYIHTIDPHVPYIPPRKYRDLYDANPYKGQVEPSGTAKLLERIKTGDTKLSGRDKFRLEALYDGEITYHDDNLARVHEALAEAGLLDDTLIVVTSDHGEEFFDHGSVGHGHTVYEELLHVPLVVRLPGAAAGAGARCRAEVGLVDLLPTACEILGTECPEGMEGRSLVPLLQGAGRDRWPQVTFADFLDGQRSARAGRYKIIYRGLARTLFDLEVDPEETRDLSDEQPIAFAALNDLLGQHQGRFVPTEAPAAPSKPGKKAAPKKTHQAEETEIDEETRKQLEGLGYFKK
jgi:arylsulfatase A-like enzyme